MAQTIVDRNIKGFDANKCDEYTLYANGVSLIIHAVNPYVPTVHANFRYLEVVHKETSKKNKHKIKNY